MLLLDEVKKRVSVLVEAALDVAAASEHRAARKRARAGGKDPDRVHGRSRERVKVLSKRHVLLALIRSNLEAMGKRAELGVA